MSSTFRLLSANRSPNPNGFDGGFAATAFVSSSVEDMVKAVTGVDGFTPVAARDDSTVTKAAKKLRPSWLSTVEKVFPLWIRDVVEMPKLPVRSPLHFDEFISAFEKLVKDALPGRLPGNDLKSYLSRDTATKMSPYSAKFLFFVYKETRSVLVIIVRDPELSPCQA